MSRHPARLIVAALGLIVVTGCGSPTTNTISANASETLSKQIAAVRAAAGNHDDSGARQRLAQLRTTVSALQGQGQLSATKASDILAAATAVDAQLNAPTTTTTIPTETANAPASGTTSGGVHGHKKGK